MKNKNNKIKIYKMPLYAKIIIIYILVFFLGLSGFGIFIGITENNQEVLKYGIIVVIPIILFGIIEFLTNFRNYILFDYENKNIIISKDLKKEVITTVNLVELKVVYNKYKYYTLDFIYTSYTKSIDWTSYSYENRGYFITVKQQAKRLTKFANGCNKIINSNK